MSGVVRKGYCRPSKRLKTRVYSNEIDRISKLPEDLIVHILSFLPTGDCIKTGALSRIWQSLWTCVDHLEFDEELVCGHNDFAEVVSKTLSVFNGSKVKSLVLKWCGNWADMFHYDSWCCFAVEQKVEKFVFGNCMNGDEVSYYTLPQFVYTNSSFKELLFCICTFDIKESVSWNSLKVLTILFPDFGEESLEKIVAGAPALEILDLQLEFGITQFDFGNLVCLKKLNVYINGWRWEEGMWKSNDDEYVAEIEISAPSVQSLQVSGRFQTCKLVDTASLLEATFFGQWDPYPILTRQVLDSLLNVHTLTLDTWVIQGIAKLLTKPSFSKCKCLTIDTHLWKEDPSAIDMLLKSTPGIETLIVTFNRYTGSRLERDKSYIDQFWTSLEMASNYLSHLKTVKFFDFWTYRTAAFPFLEFLLKKAMVLQKVIVNLETKKAYTINHIDPTQLFETSRTILSSPRSSPDAQVLINP